MFDTVDEGRSLMTGIVDYGVGNIFSLVSSLDMIGERAVLAKDEGVTERL